MSLLEINDLTTIFVVNAVQYVAVDSVSILVDAGETVGLVGESGSGKSVTALSIMRLIRSPGKIAGGAITFDGVDLLALSEAEMRNVRGKRIAMIFQDPVTSLDPMMPIGRQLSEAVTAHGARDDVRAQVLRLLDEVGIPDGKERLNDYPHQFSGGMCQRLGIAMALASRPDLILADEITTALDVSIQAQILDLLRSITRSLGVSMLLITHDLGVAATSTDRIHVMYGGQIVEQASTTELFDNPQMPYTWGLLESLPRLTTEVSEPLRPIDGQPYNASADQHGCRFEPRCRYRRPMCSEEAPQLLQVPGAEEGHVARCFGVQEIPGGGWLRDPTSRQMSPGVAPDGSSTRTLVGESQ